MFVSKSEQWRPIPIKGFKRSYEVSNTGKVRSVPRYVRRNHNSRTGLVLRKGTLLKQTYDRKGYPRVNLYNGHGKHKVIRVHRLVAGAFLLNPHHYTQVNHKDENKKNNNVFNLEWCTQKYNANYGTCKLRIQLHLMQNAHYQMHLILGYKYRPVILTKNKQILYRSDSIINIAKWLKRTHHLKAGLPFIIILLKLLLTI